MCPNDQSWLQKASVSEEGMGSGEFTLEGAHTLARDNCFKPKKNNNK